MKTTIKGFIHYRESGIGGAEYKFFPFEMTTAGFTTVMPYSFEVEIPADFDPRAEQVKALRAEKIKLMAAFQARCTEIEQKISELTAISCEVAT